MTLAAYERFVDFAWSQIQPPILITYLLVARGWESELSLSQKNVATLHVRTRSPGSSPARSGMSSLTTGTGDGHSRPLPTGEGNGAEKIAQLPAGRDGGTADGLHQRMVCCYSRLASPLVEQLSIAQSLPLRYRVSSLIDFVKSWTYRLVIDSLSTLPIPHRMFSGATEPIFTTCTAERALFKHKATFACPGFGSRCRGQRVEVCYDVYKPFDP
jgi:hypothetical protein